jgi:hypothetical protein
MWCWSSLLTDFWRTGRGLFRAYYSGDQRVLLTAPAVELPKRSRASWAQHELIMNALLAEVLLNSRWLLLGANEVLLSWSALPYKISQTPADKIGVVHWHWWRTKAADTDHG